MRKIAALSTAALTAGLLAGCASQAAVPIERSANHPAAAVSASPCKVQVTAWAGKSYLTQKVADDLNRVQVANVTVVRALSQGANTGGPSALLTAVATQLEADATVADASPPPDCLPGAVGPFHTAMAEFRQAGQDMVAESGNVSDGDYSAAIPQVKAAEAALNEGSANIAQTTAAVTAYKQAS